MPFSKDPAYAEAVGNFYGEYMATYRSAKQQVHAHLFKRGEWLVAYVSYENGLEPQQVTDAYLGELNRYARESGFEDRLKLLQTVG